MMLVCLPMISNTCSIRDRFGDLECKSNTSTLCRAHCVATMLEYRPQTQHDASQPSSLSVVPRGRPQPDLHEAVPFFDHCYQQSCIVDTCRSRLSAISRKENPTSSSPISRPRSNSENC
ncbi:hypothetical protein TNCV_3271241 [Trichonephila clavipes]|nr:hypothetical protein TNCV_3271241 [Trichonephila clavipes]